MLLASLKNRREGLREDRPHDLSSPEVRYARAGDAWALRRPWLQSRKIVERISVASAQKTTMTNPGREGQPIPVEITASPISPRFLATSLQPNLALLQKPEHPHSVSLRPRRTLTMMAQLKMQSNTTAPYAGQGRQSPVLKLRPKKAQRTPPTEQRKELILQGAAGSYSQFWRTTAS